MNLLESQSKLETRESEMRKVRSNLDDAVTSLCIVCQEGFQGYMEGSRIYGHGAEGRLNYLFGEWRDLGQRMRADDRDMNDSSDRGESFVRQINKVEVMSREARDRECNTRDKAIVDINK